MYLCVCHGLNELAVRQACLDGACTPGRVYRYFGVKPQCAKCVGAIKDTVEASTSCQTSECMAADGYAAA